MPHSTLTALTALTATEGLVALNQQSLTAQAWAESCLERIRARDGQVHAWEYINSDLVMNQAIARDQSSDRFAPLWGVPVGVKDIIATADMPTQWGTPLYAGRQFTFDATVVERLRGAGAVLVGKTVTTEYASGIPARTRNPRNLEHTPGASSSGSAAAVADGMVPLAIGSQTMGSVIRPAAYCGVFGYKPSFGLVSRYGVLPVSRELDHVGWFARSVADLAVLASVLVGSDRRDADAWVAGHPAPPDWTLTPLSQPPTIALLRGPFWHLVEPEGQEHLLQVAQQLQSAGAQVTEMTLPDEFSDYFDHVETLACAGLAVNHGGDYERGGDRLSTKLKSLIEQGQTLSPLAYANARHATQFYVQHLANLFSQFDVILTPATTGTAPHGLENTGNPIFCALWSLTGFPAVAVPSGTGANGLPLAVQVVGDRGRDPALLNTVQWIVDQLGHGHT